MESSGNKERELRVQAAELRKDMSQLDLHGMMPEQAMKEVDSFLDRQNMNGEDSVRIVYGIGTGEMRRRVLEHLKNGQSIESVKEDQQQASCIVIFREGG